MGAYHFRLPDIGEGVAEAEIAAWHVKVGDAVAEDQTLVDVMTDKATVDMTSPVEGVVTAIHGDPGQMVPVGSVLVELEVEGRGNVAERTAAPAPLPVFERPARHEAEDAPEAPAVRVPLAAPATRRRAQEAGIALETVTGTGPGGRILRQDVEAHIASAGKGQAVSGRSPKPAVHDERITGLRRKIAERMEQAARIPQITYVEEVDVTELEALRQDMNAHRGESEPRLSLLPFLIRALVRVLPEFPRMNAHFDAEAAMLRRFEGAHVGIATQTGNGLMVPVIRHAEARDLDDCARELARLAQAARDGTVSRGELSGSTITITSLGALGGIATTPMLNPPEVAIIGPNRIVDRPAIQGGLLSVRKVMNISSSFDHRIIDGQDAALFIQRLKRLLEHPALIFMDRET